MQRYILLHDITIPSPVSEEDGDYTAPAGSVAWGREGENGDIIFGCLPSEVDSTAGWPIDWKGKLGTDVALYWGQSLFPCPADAQISPGHLPPPPVGCRWRDAEEAFSLAQKGTEADRKIADRYCWENPWAWIMVALGATSPDAQLCLYGSRVAGSSVEQSDLDVAYEGMTSATASKIVYALLDAPCVLDLAEGCSFIAMPGTRTHIPLIQKDEFSMHFRYANPNAVSTKIRSLATIDKLPKEFIVGLDDGPWEHTVKGIQSAVRWFHRHPPHRQPFGNTSDIQLETIDEIYECQVGEQYLLVNGEYECTSPKRQEERRKRLLARQAIVDRLKAEQLEREAEYDRYKELKDQWDYSVNNTRGGHTTRG